MNFLPWDKIDATKQLVFMHLPRTAGTSFRWLASAEYSNEKVCLIHPGHYTEEEAIEQQGRFKFITGHFDTKSELLSSLENEVNFLTILREPVRRFISFHEYTRVKQVTWDHHVTSLVDGIKDPNCLYNNNLCYTIAGLASLTPIDVAYRKACENLRERFTLFGFTERFPEMLAIMNRRFGWSNVILRREEHVDRVVFEDLDLDLQRTLIKHNEADNALYAYAVKLYEERRMEWLR